MKKTMVGLSVMLMLVGMVGIAQANSYKDTYDPCDIEMSSGWGGVSHIGWNFDITHDLGATHYGTYGFNPATEDVVSAAIALNLSDCDSDEGHWFWWWWVSGEEEWAKFMSEGTATQVWEVDTGTTTFTVTSLAALNDDGSIHADLWATCGDFKFLSASLTAETTNQPVPEPATMLLLGTGLTLMGVRRRQAKQA